jgi:hypothetical protein
VYLWGLLIIGKGVMEMTPFMTVAVGWVAFGLLYSVLFLEKPYEEEGYVEEPIKVRVR